MFTKKLKIAVALLGILAFANAARSTEDPVPSTGISHARAMSALTARQIIEARTQYTVEVLSFDTSKRYGSQFPYSDYVKLRITNNSPVTLPYLTPLTKRYSGGHAIGWSRAPAIPVHDLAPKQSKVIDYYPHGHLSVVPVDKLTLEIEPVIDDEDARFFKELAP